MYRVTVGKRVVPLAEIVLEASNKEAAETQAEEMLEGCPEIFVWPEGGDVEGYKVIEVEEEPDETNPA